MSENFYQEFKVFQSLYPFDEYNKIAYGGQGGIYKSDNFAIKKIHKFEYFVDEVFFNIKVNHPNILKLIAWSTDNKCYYICYPLGLDVEKMYNENKISLDDIISHTLSAILYLFSIKICHNDIWLSNLIYHDVCVKLIDFGCSIFNLNKDLFDFRECICMYQQLTFRPYCEKLQFLVDHYDDDDLPKVVLEFLNVKQENIAHKRLRDVEKFEISKNSYNLEKLEMQYVNELFSKCIHFNIQRNTMLEDCCVWICCESKRKLIKMDEDVVLLIVKTLD